MALFIILQPFNLFADIYEYIDDDGTICFTDSPPKGKRIRLVYSEKDKKSTPSLYKDIAHEIAKEHSLNPALVKAIITAESNWDPKAISKKGAMGLMQLMPATAQALNVRNPYDPEENIRAGIRYFKYLLDKFNGDLVLALAAYNAGPSVVERFGRVPPINETLQYVKKVLSLSGYDKNVKLKVNKRKEEIYMIRLQDGSILYTNSAVSFPY